MSSGRSGRLSDMTNERTFTSIITVAVPVSDQERTKAVLEGLGFETRMDADVQDGFRWIELALAGADTTVSLVQAYDGLPTGIDAGMRLATPDARMAHAQLGLGLDVGELL